MFLHIFRREHLVSSTERKSTKENVDVHLTLGCFHLNVDEIVPSKCDLNCVLKRR